VSYIEIASEAIRQISQC